LAWAMSLALVLAWGSNTKRQQLWFLEKALQ